MALEVVQKRLAIVPGLGDHEPANQAFFGAVAERYKRRGFDPVVFQANWGVGGRRVEDMLDELAESGAEVGLGASVGGGLLAVFAAENSGFRGVAVAARYNTTTYGDYPTLDALRAESPACAAVAETVERLPGGSLTPERFMGIRIPNDNRVPPEAGERSDIRMVDYKGLVFARNGVDEHHVGIAKVLSLPPQEEVIVQFLKKSEEREA